MRRATVLTAVMLVAAVSLVGCAKDTGFDGVDGQRRGDRVQAQPGPDRRSGPGPRRPWSPRDERQRAEGRACRSTSGGRGDASFNDAAAGRSGPAKAQLGVADSKELTAAIGRARTATAGRLRQLVAGGYNPVIGVGFKYEPAIEAVAPSSPNVKFALIDSIRQGCPNVTPLVFAEEQGSFLVGAAAALKTQDLPRRLRGRVQTPLIQKFEAGFKQGAKAVALGRLPGPSRGVEPAEVTSLGQVAGSILMPERDRLGTLL